MAASSDFLSENNLAGQNLLRLASRGNAIIAELLRLSDNIPAVFLLSDKAEQAKYGNVIFDFRYLKSVEYYENRIENSAELLEADAELKESQVDLLKRFYSLFESIYRYGQDFLNYLEDLDQGLFIQQTLESVLHNQEGGKQLIAEVLYLFGVILILLDERIEGVVRERMLIAYLRYKGQSELPLIDEVCKLCGSTGFVKNKPYPTNYPEDFFARLKVPNVVVKMIIGRLRSDDIYNQLQCYPLPEHRSTALATQACMLYIILYFAPDILKNENATMREIVDKHFSDNWVVSYYLGYVVDLSVVWEPYKAAKLALANTTAIPNVKSLQQNQVQSVTKCIETLDQFLTEGVLTDEYVMDNTSKLMNALRECNVTIRWLTLHTGASKIKKVRDTVVQGFDPEKFLVLLLKTAQFEWILKNIFEALLDSKQVRWDKSKTEAQERMKELSEYFSGEKLLARGKKNENLQKWFTNLADKISTIEFQDSTKAGRRIQQLIQALTQVEQFPDIEDNLQVKQFLADTRSFLLQMIRVVNIKEEYLVIIQGVSDISYAWILINNYVELMQTRIKADPSSVLLLRATFLKLASILDLPLVRISQCNSPDLVSVSEYYSSELVDFVRRVMEIIPRSMFQALREIIDLQTNKISELPTKVEKDKLKDFAQLDQRFALARATYSVSVLTSGILAMETTLVGVIKVDPRQLLEDGVRKELVQSLAMGMDRSLVFKNGRIEDLENKLKALASQLDGLRRAFQYVQDYVAIYALKIWQEEFSRIVNFNVEQECNTFLRKKIYDWQSPYQRRDIPIPKPPPQEGDKLSVNFIGRLARELLNQTNYRGSTTIYLDNMSGWYNYSGRELIGIRTFTLLLASVGVFGLSGLDKLYSFMLVKHLQEFVVYLRKQMDKSLMSTLNGVAAELNPVTALPLQSAKFYSNAMDNVSKLLPVFTDLMGKLGQIQLFRRHIANTLNFTSKLDSNTLFCSLEAENNSLLADIQAHYRQPDTKPYPDDDNPIITTLTTYLETSGISDPFSKIYITTPPIDGLPVLVFLLVLQTVLKYQYNAQLNLLTPRSKDSIDATVFVVGVITFLKQFHSLHTQKFLAYLGQYVRSHLNVTLIKEGKVGEWPAEATNVLIFLEDFCRFSGFSRKIIEGFLPAYIFDYFKH